MRAIFNMINYFVLLMLLSSLTFANDDQFERYFEAMQFEKTMNQMKEQTLQRHLQAQRDINQKEDFPNKEAFLEDLKKLTQNYVEALYDMEKTKKQIKHIVSAKFTEEEIQKLITFYETPLGQKSVSLTPEIFQDIMTWLMTEQSAQQIDFQAKIANLKSEYKRLELETQSESKSKG